jgi:integrase
MRPRGTGGVRQRAGGALAIRYQNALGQTVQESVAKVLGKPPSQVTQADAERLLQRRLGEIQLGTYSAPTIQKLTMTDLFAAKRADLEVRGRLGEVKSLRSILSDLGRLEQAFGPIRASMLSTAMVQHWLDRELAAGAAPGTLAKLTDYLRATFKYAQRTQQVTHTPYIPRLAASNARQGFMTDSETAQLLAHAPPPVDDIIECARLVGWRREEIFGLTWSMVNREAREMRLPTSKNGHPRVVALRGEIGALIEKRWHARALGSPYVFHRHGRRMKQTQWYRLFHAARAAAGLPDARLHDYRRVAYRELRRSGAPESLIMEITGHRSFGIAKRYAIQDPELQGQALERRDAHVAAERAAIPGHVVGQVR